MNLLAESQGLPEAFRILSLFEHQFMTLWEARNISIRQKPPSVGNILKESKSKIMEKDSQKDDEVKKEKKDKEGSESEADDNDDLMENTRLQSIIVSWDDAAIARYFYRYTEHTFG